MVLLAGIIYTTSNGFLTVYGKVKDPNLASMQSIVGNNQTNTLDNVTNENVLPPTQGETESKDNSATNLDESTPQTTDTQQSGTLDKEVSSQSSNSQDSSDGTAKDEDKNTDTEDSSNTSSATDGEKNTTTDGDSTNQLSGIIPRNESDTSETKSEGQQGQDQQQNAEDSSNTSSATDGEKNTTTDGDSTNQLSGIIPQNESDTAGTPESKSKGQQQQDQQQNTEDSSNTSAIDGEQVNETSNVQPLVQNNESASQDNGNTLPNAETSPNVPQVDLLSNNTTEDQPLPADTESSENMSGLAGTSNASLPTEVGSDTLGQITSPEDILGNQTSEEIDTAASEIAGLANINSTTENNDISNIQSVINTIALSSGQSGGNAKLAAGQISKEIAANPKGEVAKAVQSLAGEYSKGNSDEINIAAKQIGTLIAKGNNIKQTFVQVTNKVVNNIKNIKNSIENYDKIIVHPKTSSVYKGDIDQTINLFKNSKQRVDVPQVHIKFDDHERNLVLRVLTTNNYRYDMPFSKYNGAFTLDDNEFRVKIVSGDGFTKAASVAKIFKSGKVGDRNFLDKDIRNGKVYFSLDGIDDGKYLLEVYVKLSNGYIGTFARGSVSIR